MFALGDILLDYKRRGSSLTAYRVKFLPARYNGKFLHLFEEFHMLVLLLLLSFWFTYGSVGVA